jgi:hypothetical protein
MHPTYLFVALTGVFGAGPGTFGTPLHPETPPITPSRAAHPRAASALLGAPSPIDDQTGIATAPDDIIFLKNGGRVRGTCLEHDPDKGTTVRLFDGSTRRYAPGEVLEVRYQAGPTTGATSHRSDFDSGDTAPRAPVVVDAPSQDPSTNAATAAYPFQPRLRLGFGAVGGAGIVVTQAASGSGFLIGPHARIGAQLSPSAALVYEPAVAFTTAGNGTGLLNWHSLVGEYKSGLAYVSGGLGPVLICAFASGVSACDAAFGSTFRIALDTSRVTKDREVGFSIGFDFRTAISNGVALFPGLSVGLEMR